MICAEISPIRRRFVMKHPTRRHHSSEVPAAQTFAWRSHYADIRLFITPRAALMSHLLSTINARQPLLIDYRAHTR